MSPSFRQPRIIPVALLLFAMLALLLPAAGALGEGAPYKEVPGYPKYGCYDVIVGGNGMWGGNTLYPITVDVPGPVVDAHLVWIGTEDVGAPGSPTQSDLTVNGAGVLGQLVDQYQAGPSDPPWYMWRADIGPSGLNMVSQGVNKYTITGWNLLGPTGTRRNGISVVVTYSTGACAKPNQVNLIDNMDWYWERNGGTTDVLAFTFPPSPMDRDVTVWLHHAGSTHVSQVPNGDDAALVGPDEVLPSACRGMNLWAKSGTGAPPPTLVEYSNDPPTPAFGGQLVVTNPFVGSNCANTTWTWPVTGLLGWVDTQGWTRDTGGYIGPEWSIVRVTYRVRAGETYLALQLESEKTNSPDVLLTGESGAWFAQAVIPLEDIRLRINKTDGVTTAAPGDTLTYTINYENFGPTPAANTVIVDTLPERATFVSASNGGTYDAGTRTVTWNVGTLAPAAQGQVTLQVQLDPLFPAGTTTLTNSVTITTPGEADTSDNTATDTTDVVAQAQLNVEKTGAPEPVAPGENLTYTVNWSVGGNAFSENTTLVDDLPDNVTFVSATNGGVYDAGAGTVTWSLGSITPAANGSVSLVVKVNADQTNGATITNLVTMTNQAGDSDTDTEVNTVRTASLLSITKTNNLPDGGAATPGGELIWTLSYSVAGTGTSQNVTITDPLPTEVDFVSASNGGTYNAATRTVTWNLGNLTGGTEGSVTLTVRLKTPLPGVESLTNTATIRDDAGNTDEDSDTVPVRALPILTVTKTNDPISEVEPGDVITYKVCVGNTGVGDATNVVMTDPIPTNTTYVPGSATGSPVFSEITNTLTWTQATLAPGAELCGTFQVRVNTVITGANADSIDNTVTAKADGVAPKSATVSNPLLAIVDPLIFKAVDRSEVLVGDEIVFTLTIRNDGNAAATNVVVTDQIPPRLDGVSATTTKGAAVYDPITRLLTVTVGQLNPSETVIVIIRGTAAAVPADQLPYTITNEAVISFTEGAPRTSNRVTVTVNYPPPDEIPEPGTWLMLGAGFASMAGYARMRVQARRRKQQA